MADLFAGATRPLVPTFYPNLAAAQVDYPFVTSGGTESVWAMLRKSFDAVEAIPVGRRPRLELDAEGYGFVDRPLVLPSHLHFYGQGHRNTTIQATPGHLICGPMLCGLSVAQLTDTGVNGFGPLGDKDGFILENRAGAVLDFADTSQFFNPPADGSWWFEIDLRWDSGAVSVWSLGNRLATGVGREVLAKLSVTDTGILQAHAPSTAVVGPTLVSGVFYTVRVTIGSTGTLTLAVNGVTFVAAGSVPVTISWFTSLIIGASQTTVFPWGLLTATPPGTQFGRVKNAKLGQNGLTIDAPLTDGNTPFFVVYPGLGGLGYLFARAEPTYQGHGGMNLHDFAIEGSGAGTGLYLNNFLNSMVARLSIHGFNFGLALHRNTYSNSVRDCFIHGNVCAAMGVGNAGQTPWDGNTYYGGKCCFASDGSYGVQVRDGWMVNTFGPDAIHMLLSGSGATHSVSGTIMFNEGTDPRWLVLLRETQASFFGQSIVRYSRPARPVVAVDGGWRYTFDGGALSGILDQPVPVFEKLSAPRFPVRVSGVWRSDTPGVNMPAPWTDRSDPLDVMVS